MWRWLRYFVSFSRVIQRTITNAESGIGHSEVPSTPVGRVGPNSPLYMQNRLHVRGSGLTSKSSSSNLHGLGGTQITSLEPPNLSSMDWSSQGSSLTTPTGMSAESAEAWNMRRASEKSESLSRAWIPISAQHHAPGERPDYAVWHSVTMNKGDDQPTLTDCKNVRVVSFHPELDDIAPMSREGDLMCQSCRLERMWLDGSFVA